MPTLLTGVDRRRPTRPITMIVPFPAGGADGALSGRLNATMMRVLVDPPV